MFCCEIPSLQLCLSVHTGNPFSFPNGLDSAFYMLPHVVGTAKRYQPKKAELSSPSQASSWWGKKVGRNLLLLFKCCNHSLLPRGAQEGQRHNSEPPLLSPPFPVSSLKSCSCVPWSKEAVILGRLHVSYSGQGEVITSSSHTAQSC